MKKDTFFWWNARENGSTILTLALIVCLLRLPFKSLIIIKIKQLEILTVFVLQPLNPFQEYYQFLAEGQKKNSAILGDERAIQMKDKWGLEKTGGAPEKKNLKVSRGCGTLASRKL